MAGSTTQPHYPLSSHGQNSLPTRFVQCLTAIAQHHGLQVNPERLIEEFSLPDDEPRPALVVRMAAAIGLKGKLDKLSWKGCSLRKGFPFIGLMRDNRAVIVVEYVLAEGRGRRGSSAKPSATKG